MIIKCPRCSEYHAVIYTEGGRKYIECKHCGYQDYLKGNQYAKNKDNS